MRHAVLIGDFVESRRLSNRREIQRQFAAACLSLNKEKRQLGLASPLTITLGDEFQAVFTHAGRLWECIFRLEAAMAPVNIRFAIGLGEIATDIQHDTALGMDGPAFHEARAAMEQMKKSDARYRVGGLQHSRKFINDVLELVAHNRLKWRTPRVITMASLLQQKSVKEICLLTGSTEQAVYRNIRDGALDTIGDLLSEITQRMDATLTQTDPCAEAQQRQCDGAESANNTSAEPRTETTMAVTEKRAAAKGKGRGHA